MSARIRLMISSVDLHKGETAYTSRINFHRKSGKNARCGEEVMATISIH